MGKRLGQHFLTDKSTAKKIVEHACITKDDTVLEIGPGRGILTELILSKAGELIAVELDYKLANFLKSRFGKFRNFTLINKDFLKLEPVQGRRIKFVANLPYYITSPILQKIISWHDWQAAVITIQKEVADRIVSGPGTKDYGVLTVSVNLKAKAERLFVVPRRNFSPAPKVDSAVVKLTPLQKMFLDESEEENFFKLVHACFQQRRKTLVNSVSHKLGLDKSKIRGILERLGLSPQIRPEEIDLNTYINLYRDIFEVAQKPPLVIPE